MMTLVKICVVGRRVLGDVIRLQLRGIIMVERSPNDLLDLACVQVNARPKDGHYCCVKVTA